MINHFKSYKTIVFLLLIVCLTSCKKEEKNFGLTTYQGKVFERGSTVGISNCPVFIFKSTYTGFMQPNTFTLVAETYSDSNGVYSLSWNAEDGASYYIYTQSPKHYGFSKGNSEWKLNKFGKTISFDLEQWPLAYVKMKLLNRKKHKDYTEVTFGSRFTGITLSPRSKDTVLTASIWGNVPDTLGSTLYNGINQIKTMQYGFRLSAWQTDSITIEY